ncbi:MAG: secondary thiamine-phosphate synthase enzyme YjbQ [Chloroflexi bacterium]|nr:secondary thiamine-phosphate synthase enzyme YjbQ [Chloroflexota bacterium]MDA1004535.1 secondary thiamine-phosphate synthase enzyme YjbQ [Chloroflexota bacterium]
MEARTRQPIARPMHSVAAPAAMFVSHGESLEYETTHALEFIDITEDVQAVVERSGVQFGQVAIFSNHTTAAVILNEHEPLLLNDMARVLSRMAPAGNYYEHNDFSIRTVNLFPDECANGHSHCQHLFLGSSETIPVHEGRAHLGRFQSVFLVELDHARMRRVYVQTMGSAAG